MIRRILRGLGAVALAAALGGAGTPATPGSASSPPADRPPAFLDQPDGTEALAWVRERNQRTLGRLKGDPRYAEIFAQALDVGQAKDRIPHPDLLGGAVYDFRQDADHVRGIWRATTVDGFRASAPPWRTVLDLDRLATVDHANWVWEGADCREPDEERCMVSLSDGGEDAVTEREFDLRGGRFVPGGLVLPRSKQREAWEDADHLLVARDWGPGTLTAAGYGFVVKRVARGQALADARTVYAGRPTDTEVDPVTVADASGHRYSLITRGLDFFRSEVLLVTPNGTERIDLPEKTRLVGLVQNRLVAEIDQDWQPQAGPHVPAGSLVSIDMANRAAPPAVVFSPTDTQSLGEDTAATGNALVATVYDDVRGEARVFRPAGSGWSGMRLPLPDQSSVTAETAGLGTSVAYLSVQGFLRPAGLWEADLRAGTVRLVQQAQPKFASTGLVVEQGHAVSSDGTRIPYFIVHRRGMRLDGNNPTLLYAYGGFQVSMTPTYSGSLGRLWLTRGGVYVLANIRGGGEFGPRWHEAGLKTRRQRVFDDFAAVGRDLVERKVTRPDRLGIRGGSNGGLLMGVEFTQHPGSWGAAIIDVPLLDMERFETMSAGASWVGEYGSMAVAEQAAFLRQVSPLRNLKSGVRYPEPFIFTTTKDDRVGPVHARRFAWRMEQLGDPFLYYEETEGGHAAGANLREKAEEQALEFTYLSEKLMGGWPGPER